MSKLKYLLVLLILFSIITISFSLAKEKKPLEDKIIFLDAGHGGLDPGTLYNNIYEKDINLKIALYLKDSLENLGAKVLLTRDGDYDLSKPNARYRKKSDFDNRIKIINNSKADLYISIHLNYLENSKYYGAQVFYNKKNELNQKIAEKLQENFNKELNSDKTVKNIPTSTYMYSKLKPPGVLIECGFLSNSNERELLTKSEYQKKIADIIAVTLKVF